MTAASQVITSPANALLKEVRRAAARGSATADGFFVAESPHLLEEALRSGLEIKAALASRRASRLVETLLAGRRDIAIRIVEDRVFSQLASTEATQGVISLVRMPVWRLDDLFGGRALVVVLDGLQDPGNVGAAVRAAEAFGATGVVFLKGTVHAANPKTLRASAGSLFRLPFIEGVEAEALSREFQNRSLKTYAATPAAEKTLEQCDLTVACAVVIGSEAHGVSSELLRNSRRVRIPTAAVESLNAAVAAGVILYEAARQRALRPGRKES